HILHLIHSVPSSKHLSGLLDETNQIIDVHLLLLDKVHQSLRNPFHLPKLHGYWSFISLHLFTYLFQLATIYSNTTILVVISIYLILHYFLEFKKFQPIFVAANFLARVSILHTRLICLCLHFELNLRNVDMSCLFNATFFHNAIVGIIIFHFLSVMQEPVLNNALTDQEGFLVSSKILFTVVVINDIILIKRKKELSSAGRGYMERGNRPNEAVATCLGIQIKIHHTAFCATELICEVLLANYMLICVIGIGQGDNEHKMIYYMKLAAAESQIVAKEIHAVTNLSQEVVMEEIVQENEEDMEDDFISNETFLQFDVAKIKEKRENC
ncbi:hypothetical protein ACJX0J_014737, partial [Zea mays]